MFKTKRSAFSVVLSTIAVISDIIFPISISGAFFFPPYLTVYNTQEDNFCVNRKHDMVHFLNPLAICGRYVIFHTVKGKMYKSTEKKFVIDTYRLSKFVATSNWTISEKAIYCECVSINVECPLYTTEYNLISNNGNLLQLTKIFRPIRIRVIWIEFSIELQLSLYNIGVSDERYRKY